MPGQVQRAEQERKTLLLQSEVTVRSHHEFAGTSQRKMSLMTGNRRGGGLGLSPCFVAEGNVPLEQAALPNRGSRVSQSPSPGTAGSGASEPAPLRARAGLLLALRLLLFSGTDNSGNKIPSPDNGPIQLRIPLCLCQQCAPNAELERVAASKPLLPFPLNSPSDSSFRMKLLTLSLSPKDLFRSCWIFLTKLIWLFLTYARGEIFFKRTLDIF